MTQIHHANHIDSGLHPEKSDVDDGEGLREQFLLLAVSLTSLYELDIDEDNILLSIHTEETKIALNLDVPSRTIGLYADIGLPLPRVESVAYKEALLRNLVIGPPSMVIGLHPQSYHLVAVSYISMNDTTDLFHTSINAVKSLEDVVKQVRSKWSE